MSSAKDVPSGSCVELYLQQELEILKEENHSLVTELENLKKKDVCCTLRKNDDTVCFPMDQGAHWAFSSSIKCSQNFSFFWKLFIHFFRTFVKFVDKNTECMISEAHIFFTLIDLCDEKSCLDWGSTLTSTWDLPYDFLYFVTCVKFTRWYASSPRALTIWTVKNFRQMVLVFFWHRKQERDWVGPFTKYR